MQRFDKMVKIVARIAKLFEGYFILNCYEKSQRILRIHKL